MVQDGSTAHMMAVGWSTCFGSRRTFSHMGAVSSLAIEPRADEPFLASVNGLWSVGSPLDFFWRYLAKVQLWRPGVPVSLGGQR